MSLVDLSRTTKIFKIVQQFVAVPPLGYRPVQNKPIGRSARAQYLELAYLIPALPMLARAVLFNLKTLALKASSMVKSSGKYV